MSPFLCKYVIAIAITTAAMRNSFLFLVCLLASLTMNARQTFVEVNTDKTSLIVVVDQVGALRTAYYGVKGPRLSDFERGTSACRSVYGGPDMAYSTQGGINVLEPALKVRYADEYMNTELYYVCHEIVRNDGCTVTRVLLKDPVTAIEVTLVYEAFVKEDVIRTHAQIRNGGKKEVELLNFYSSDLSLNADRYLFTSFHGEWGGKLDGVHHRLLQTSRVPTRMRLPVSISLHTQSRSLFVRSLQMPA
jgi:alpha-galactosidase